MSLSYCEFRFRHFTFSARCSKSGYFIPYLLTPCRRVLLEKLTGSQLVKKFPAFYATRRFFTACTSARHLSLSRARSILSMPPSYFLMIQINIILPSTPGSSKWSLYTRFLHQNPVCTSPLPHTCFIPHKSHYFRFDQPNDTWWGVPLSKLLADTSIVK